MSGTLKAVNSIPTTAYLSVLKLKELALNTKHQPLTQLVLVVQLAEQWTSMLKGCEPQFLTSQFFTF